MVYVFVYHELFYQRFYNSIFKRNIHIRYKIIIKKLDYIQNIIKKVFNVYVTFKLLSDATDNRFFFKFFFLQL